MSTTIEFFRVGGCVRDELLGLRSKDIDFAVEAPSFAAMQTAVEGRVKKVFLITEEFLTIRALDLEFGPVDFVLCRKDGPSSDGRRPDFVTPGTIFDDLDRRDFTVNAMAIQDRGFVNLGQPVGDMRVTGLIDPHNGRDDLDQRLLRFVGDPAERLSEDALRAFRALRFTVTKGFRMVDQTAEAIANMRIVDFDGVSTDRIRDELLKACAVSTGHTIQLLRRFEVLFDLMLARGIWFKPTTEKA